MYKKSDFLIIEGDKDILELLESNPKIIDKILWHKKSVTSEIFEKIGFFAQKLSIKLEELTAQDFKNLRKTVHSKGIFAKLKFEKFHSDLETTLKKSKLVIILDKIQDPGNFGTIIRTSNLLNVDAIITTNGSIHLANPKTLRATKGYFSNTPIFENVDITKLTNLLEKYKFYCNICDIDGESIYDEKLKFEKPTCLFFGSEGQGFCEFLENGAKKITIDMPKKGESLNLAISVGIMIYEVNKRWKLNKN